MVHALVRQLAVRFAAIRLGRFTSETLMAYLMSQKNRGVLVVYINEPKLLDERIITSVGGELNAMMDRAENGMLLVNFQQVKFMSSAMLGRLVTLHKGCQKNKINLKLCNVRKDIREIFSVTRLDKLLKMYSDETDAMTAFEKDGWLLSGT
jgi:anti-sigma B factor antagonist